VWNLWWTRRALDAGTSPLWCPALFAPFGVSLLLHTHTFLTSFIAAPFVSGQSLVAATNVVVAVHLFLNFATAYALALRLTRNIAASALGALVFGWSPYIGAHLLGHFNLIAAWMLPLTILLTLDTVERDRATASQFLGLTLAFAPYVDYYYAVYAILLSGAFVASRFLTISIATRVRTDGERAILRTLAMAVAAVTLLATVIHLTGGTTIHVGSLSISMRRPDNSVAAAGILLIVAALVAFVPALTLGIDRTHLSRLGRRLLVATSIAGVGMLPLLIGTIRLWWHGDYSSQQYFWRSAPAGIDLGTLVLGNPRGLLWRGLPLATYARFGIDSIEHAAWLTPGALFLCVAAIVNRRIRHDVRRWILIGSIFLVWAVGPYIVVFGRHLPVLLPATLIRYVPIAANARIPARAMIVVYLSVAILVSYGFVTVRERAGLRTALLLAGLIVADLLPAPPPVYRLDRPPLYDIVRTDSVKGSVCELPLGIRDGFGETGLFDSRVLWYQTIHERPLVGGFIARLPRRIIPAYEAAPVLGSFLRLSAGQSVARETPLPASQAVDALLSQGVRFIVVNRLTSPPDLTAYVTRLSLRRLASDDERELLIVERHRN
jgi:hypothetical protein